MTINIRAAGSSIIPSPGSGLTARYASGVAAPNRLDWGISLSGIRCCLHYAQSQVYILLKQEYLRSHAQVTAVLSQRGSLGLALIGTGIAAFQPANSNSQH
jgi:hypothetical protein